MKNNDNKPDAAMLRQKAEELLTTHKDVIHRISMDEVDKLKLIHELEVHQIELEMQNEELLLAKEKAEIVEEKYIGLYDFAPFGYLTLSRDGKILELNFAAAKMLGNERLYLINRTFALFVSEKKRPTFTLFFHKVFTGIEKETCDLTLETVGKSPIHIHTEGIVSVNEDQILLTLVDITESKRMEQKLKETMKELENLNKTKDKFFTIIAHDLRNPFIGISGLTELMEARLLEANKEDESELLKFTQMINSSSNSSFNLLNNLMEWSKSQTGEIEITLQNIPLKYLLSNTIPMVNGNAFNKNISIEVDIADNDKVYADIDMTNTILRNLLTNAVKFTHQNGKIFISTQRKERFLEISITDTGVGIDPKNLNKIFRIDSKFSDLGTANEKGTGLGLILCKEFVEKQGGKIWVTSNSGIGSTFTFTLPVGEESLDRRLMSLT
jgi:PAS domain S-box-containing protein